MSTPQNINAANASNLDNERRYFNNFFINFGSVSTDQNDAIIAYFEKFTKGNKQAAIALASAVIYTSLSQRIDPMSVLTEFSKIPQGELNAYLATFLNLNRIGTSYLGYRNQPPVNNYIQRAIRV